MFELLKDLFRFFRLQKKLFLFPLVLVIVILGFLLVVSAGTVFAPFVYTLF